MPIDDARDAISGIRDVPEGAPEDTEFINSFFDDEPEGGTAEVREDAPAGSNQIVHDTDFADSAEGDPADNGSVLLHVQCAQKRLCAESIMHKADFAPDTDRTVLTADAADPEQGAPEHGTANDADEAEASEAGADVADEAPVEADEAEEAATVAEELDAATADRFGDTATGETDGAETGEPDDAETDEPGDTAEDAWDATGAAGDDAEGRDDAGMIASGDPNAGDGTGGGTDGPQETVCTATGAADRESDTDPQETTDGCSRVLVARTDGKGRHVADASIRVTDETGAVVADWGSGDDDHALMLADGTYTASEVATPRGAAPARDVSFAVSGGHVLGCEGNRVILTGRRSIVPIVACCVVGVAVIVAIAAFAWNRGGKNDREPLDSNVNYADNQGDITSVKSEPKIEVSEYTTFSSVSDQQWKSGSREQECVISNPAGNPVNIYPHLYINLDRSTQFAVDGNGIGTPTEASSVRRRGTPCI